MGLHSPIDYTHPCMVSAHGRREAVRDLLCTHEAALAELRAAMSSDALFNPMVHDDLWLLRYVLSHAKKGGVASALAAARACMAWRHRHNMDDPLLPCGGAAALAMPAVAKMYTALRDPAAISYYVPDPDRGTLFVSVPALIDFHKAAATVTEEEQSLAHRLTTEWLWRQCDEVTRRTGLLTKCVRLVDLKSMGLSNIPWELVRRDASNSKVTEDFYPQLLGAVFVCNAPALINVVWRGLRPVLPARILEKVDFLGTSARERARLLRWVAAEHLPERYGGSCKVWPPPNARFALARQSTDAESI